MIIVYPSKSDETPINYVILDAYGKPVWECKRGKACCRHLRTSSLALLCYERAKSNDGELICNLTGMV